MIANINTQPVIPDYLPIPIYDPRDLDSSPSGFTIFNSKLYFSANDGTNGQELWGYDGNNPPVMIANINPQPTAQDDYGEDSGFSSPTGFTVFNSKLYFSAHDGTNGHELWVYDGNNPPAMVANINPNPYWYYKGNEQGSSYPSSLTVFNSKLYFGASEDYDKAGLWVYDGTNFPTKVDYTYFRPGFLTVLGSDLYFSGYFSELWVYKLPRLPIPTSKSIAPFLYLLLNNTNIK